MEQIPKYVQRYVQALAFHKATIEQGYAKVIIIPKKVTVK